MRQDWEELAGQHLEAIRDAVSAAAKAEAAIVQALIEADGGPATRSAMAKACGLSRSTFYERYGAALDQARAERRRR